MVNYKNFIVFFIIIICSNLFSQNENNLKELSKYSNFSFTVGAVLFDKAKIEFEEGSYPISSIPIPSYTFGFNYKLPVYGKWSINTGLFFVKEAALNIKYSFLDEDILYPEQNEEIVAFDSPTFTTSIPISLNFKTKIGIKSYLDFKLGMKMMLLPPAMVGWSNAFQNDTGFCNNFRIEIYSPYNVFIHGSLISSIGYTIDLNKVLIGFELSRTINFQNTFSGRFRFYNLLTNPDAYGYYNLSGNYWALSRVC